MNYYDTKDAKNNKNTTGYNGYYEVIQGTQDRVKVTDYSQRCASCGKFFYFDHDSNRKVVACPWCGHRH